MPSVRINPLESHIRLKAFLVAALLASMVLSVPVPVPSQETEGTEAAKAALSKELAASRSLQENSLNAFKKGDQKKVRAGKVVAILEDIQGSPVKIGKGIGVIPYPPLVVMQVIADLNSYKDFMPFTKESKVDLKRSGGDVIYFYSRLDVPFIDDRYYTLKMTEEENVDGHRGTFFFFWSLDPEQKSNLFLNSGSWKLVPYGADGGKTLAYYTVVTDPGGNIPNFIKNKSTKVGVPSVFEAITERAEEGLSSGLYKRPVPEDKVDLLLRQRVKETRDLDVTHLEKLPQEDREQVLHGEFLLSMSDVEGTWVKMVHTVALFDVPSSRLWKAITAFNEYKDFIPYVAESRVEPERSSGGTTYFFSRLHFLVFPLIKDRYYTVAIAQEENLDGKEGVFFLQWWLDPTQKANVNKNCGSWKLVPYGEQNEKTLVFYTILADPGGLTPWFWKNLSARTAMKKVLRAIEQRAKQ